MENEQTQSRIAESKYFKLAFFQDSKELNERIDVMSNKLIKGVLLEVLVAFVAFTVVMILFGISRANSVSHKMTSDIIHLYETLKGRLE